MNETCRKIAKRLRARGWNYQRIEWLLPRDHNKPAWRYTIERHYDDRETTECDEIEAVRGQLLAAMRAVEKVAIRPTYVKA